MRNKKRQRELALVLMIAVLVMVALTGCTNQSAEKNSESTESPEKATVSIGSGASGGAFYMVGAALAQVIPKYEPSLLVNSEATGGTSENIRLVANKETTIGMGMADDIVTAYKGERAYEGKAADNLRILMAGQSNTFHVIVLDKSPIQKVSDLRGKNISLGPAGAPYFGPNMLKAVAGLEKDVDYKGQYLGHDQAADALANRDIDALIATVAFPSAAYSNLAMTNKVRFIEFSEEEVKNAIEMFPFWRSSKIPQGTYGLTKDVNTMSIPVWLFTDKDVSEDTIYRVVKAILEHSEELGKIHPDAGKYQLDTAIQGINLSFHPGAEKYYKEKGIQ
ncbi:MAG: TAXI family TRAP transporter solute-binding subunit [Peptococcaceae bacterium]